MKSSLSLAVEEHQVVVTLCTPATVAAVTRTVRGEEDGLALHNELTRAFGVATLSEVHDLARAISLDHSTVRVLPAAMTDIVSEDPLAVGAPAVADIAVGVGVVELLVEDL